jgi:hypothetical protein
MVSSKIKRESRRNILIELRDKGYPGATYQLLYHPVQQALSGVYYQPTAGGTFQVIFTRME